jgi:hypothetical protein
MRGAGVLWHGARRNQRRPVRVDFGWLSINKCPRSRNPKYATNRLLRRRYSRVEKVVRAYLRAVLES